MALQAPLAFFQELGLRRLKATKQTKPSDATVHSAAVQGGASMVLSIAPRAAPAAASTVTFALEMTIMPALFLGASSYINVVRQELVQILQIKLDDNFVYHHINFRPAKSPDTWNPPIAHLYGVFDIPIQFINQH